MADGYEQDAGRYGSRDRLYAVMGMAADEEFCTVLSVDYWRAAEQVFVDVARHLNKNNTGTKMLYKAGGAKNFMTLVSCVPDMDC